MSLFFLLAVGGFLQTSHFEEYLSLGSLTPVLDNRIYHAVLIKEIDCTVLRSWRRSKAQTNSQKQLFNIFFFF